MDALIVLLIAVFLLVGICLSQGYEIKRLKESNKYAWDKIQEIIQDEFMVKD